MVHSVTPDFCQESKLESVPTLCLEKKGEKSLLKAGV
jgi:hypothetical protein